SRPTPARPSPPTSSSGPATSTPGPAASRSSRRRSTCPRRRCGSSATTSPTSRATRSWARWWCSRTACPARASTAASRSARSRARTTWPPCAGSRAPAGAPLRGGLPLRRARLATEGAQPEDETGRRKKFASPPNLIVVDGGRPQLAAALEAVRASASPDLAVVSLAKRMEEGYLPGSPAPVIVPRTSEALYLLQRVRDEAHRFAITYHRKLRDRSMTRSVL